MAKTTKPKPKTKTITAPDGRKFAIHPNQVAVINRIFLPSPEELEQARRIVAAFDEARARGSAAISFEGRMIDTPVAERARNLVQLAEAIAQRDRP